MIKPILASIRIPAPIFLGIQLALSILLQLSSGIPRSILSYLTVIIAFLYALLSLGQGVNLRRALTVFALGFTAVADWFLVILASHKLIAMFFFCAVQLLYGLLIFLEDKRASRHPLHLLLRCAASLLLPLLVPVILADKTDALAVVSAFYFANLLCNLILSFSLGKSQLRLTIGLLFFLLCDIFVGLGVLCDGYLTFSEGGFYDLISSSAVDFVWLFYVPAQTLLALSAYDSTPKSSLKITANEPETI